MNNSGDKRVSIPKAHKNNKDMYSYTDEQGSDCYNRTIYEREPLLTDQASGDTRVAIPETYTINKDMYSYTDQQGSDCYDRIIFAREHLLTDQMRKCSLEDKGNAKERVISLCRVLELFLKSAEYTEDLQNELNILNPDFVDVLQKRMIDMEKTDHGIVIAGETSAGKSTLVNKILRKKIFQGSIFESTSTICKIHNSNKIEIVAESSDGRRVELDLTKQCDLATRKGVKMFRKTLQELTDKKSLETSDAFQSVEVGFPISFLKGNTILVDTPGIGGSDRVTKKLIDYLPNAVSFVFVINVASAGGMQKDRLPEILESILDLQTNNDMPCFDPEDVIFITNKWDTITKKKKDSDSDDDDEETNTWESLKLDIKRKWPAVKEDHMFKMILTDVSQNQEDSSTKEFQKFLKVLESNVEKAKNIRVLRHLRFTQELLKNIHKGLQARLDLGEKSEKEQIDLAEAHKIRINVIVDECKQIKEALKKRTKDIIEEVAQQCYNYMSTDIGKDKILNPCRQTPIMKLDWQPKLFCEMICVRVNSYAEAVLRSEDVLQKFKDIQIEIISFYERILSDILQMEGDWRDDIAGEMPSDETSVSTAAVVGVVIASSPLWLPLVAAGIGLGLAFGGVSIALSPVLIPVLAYLGRDERKKKVIDKEYNNCKEAIRSLVSNQLEIGPGKVINQLLLKVTDDLLPKRIKLLEMMIQQLMESRNEIIANKKVLLNLEAKVIALESSVKELEKIFK